jgi:hypothetical protein
LQLTEPNVIGSATMDGLVTLEPGSSRREVFREARAKLVSERPFLAKGHVMFFSLEPDDL